MNTRVHTLPRHMQAELLDALQMSRIVNLVGPRQVGKTTLVRDFALENPHLMPKRIQTFIPSSFLRKRESTTNIMMADVAGEEGGTNYRIPGAASYAVTNFFT